MKRWPATLRNLLIVIGLIAATALMIHFNQRITEMNELNEQLEEVRAQGTAVMQTQMALHTQVAYAGSDKAVEEWAYQAHLSGANETPIVLLPSGVQVTSTPQPSSLETSQPPLEVWLALFFGDY